MISKTDISFDDWHILTEPSQIESMIEASSNRPQVIYKHSHTCSVCLVAKKEIESSFEAIQKKADLHFVNVIKSRSVSNALAKQLDVRHESPQVLLVQNGECVWHASHWGIKADAILEALNENAD